MLFTGCYLLVKSMPLVFQPSGFYIFSRATVNKHNLRGRKGVENIRLVFFAYFFAQTFTAVKDTITLTCEVNIEVLNSNTIGGSFYTCFTVTFFITKKNIIRFFLTCFFNPFFAYSFDITCLICKMRLIFSIGKFYRFFVIIIFGYALDRGCITSGNFSSVKIFFVLNSILRKQTPPIGVCVLRILFDYIGIGFFRF